MNPPERFEMNSMERQSPLWLRIAAHLDAQLVRLRIENEGNKDALETAHLRGRIAQVKAIRGMGDEPPPR